MNNLATARNLWGVNRPILTTFISALLLTPVAVLAQDTQEQDDQEGILEEVIVTGTRTSLDNAADLKRTSDTIIDAITAEDIGVFSDNNIGEALARIPGVQLERQEGDGYRISVRGLGPRFVRTTLNGRTALSSPGGEGGQGGRGFSFNIIPSEVITRATVNKSFQASDIEGGIGGTVDLQTTRALDFAARQDMDIYVAGAVRATYNDLSGDTAPRGSIFANYKINDQFGFFVSAVYDVADRLVLSTESQDIDIEKFDLSAGTVLNGEVLTEDMEDIEAAVFDGVRNYSRERDRDRLTFTGGFQWQPSDNVDINFDWTHGTLEETRGEFRSWLRIEDAVDRYADKTITNMIIDTSYGNEDSMGVIMAFDFEGFDQGGTRQVLDVAHLTQTLDETYDVGGINLAWQNDNGWSIYADIGYAQQNKVTDQRRVTVGEDKKSDRWNDGFNGSFDIRTGYPIVTLTDTMGVPIDHGNADELIYTQDRMSYYLEDNEETNLRFDTTKELGSGMLKMGLSWRDKTLTREELRTNGRASEVVPIGPIGTLMVEDFFNDVNIPGFYHSYATPDYYAWAELDPGGTFSKDPRDGASRIGSEYNVGEEITALYLQYDFANDNVKLPYRGNIGVRYVDTTQTSVGIIGSQVGNDVIIFDPDFRVENKYTDWLPSFNIAFDLSDEWIARFAASRSLTRPDPRDLQIGIDLDIDDLDGSAGNWELDPYGTDNFDGILEWYPQVGGAYAFGVFYKKLDGWIADGTEDFEVDLGEEFGGVETFEIDRPVNTDGGTILGLEVSFHLPFDIFTDNWASGFGLNGSFTYIDAEMDGRYPGTDDTIDLLGTSEKSGNLVAYYQLGRFGSRLAYNWRDDFLYQEGAEGFLEYTEGTAVLDLNVDWRFNNHWRLRFSANNLTDEQTVRYFISPGLMSDIRNSGRTYVLELRANM